MAVILAALGLLFLILYLTGALSAGVFLGIGIGALVSAVLLFFSVGFRWPWD